MMLTVIQNQRFRSLLDTWPEKAIRFIYEAYYENLLIISQRITQDFLAAEDIVQAVYAHIWYNHKRFAREVDRSIEYYLVTSVKEKSIRAYDDRIKSNAARLRKANSRSDFPTDDDIIKLRDSECLSMIVARFTKLQKACFQLRYIDRLSTEEISARLNKSPAFVARKLSRIRRTLKTYQWALS